jgi:hypothetical protein
MDTALASVNVPAVKPTWRRVTHLADLVEIFDPAVQVCVWQRDTSPAVIAYLRVLEQTGTLHTLETLSQVDQDQPQLASLPAAPGRAALIDDLSLLREILCKLLGCPAVGLRLARLGYAMCPGWHDCAVVRLAAIAEDPETELSTRVDCLKTVARYTRPQLRSVEVSGDPERPLAMVSDQPMSVEQWTKQHCESS